MPRFSRATLVLARRGLARIGRSVENRLAESGGGEPFVAGIQEAYATGWAHCPCVFFMSTGRVGTRTVAALFAQSPQAVATHEPAPRLIKASFDAFMSDDRKADKWRAVVLAARDDAVASANRRGKVYVETNCRLTYLAEALAAAFPASRFVHLHRHPYEVIRSGMAGKAYQAERPWEFARIRPRTGEALADAWDDLPALEKVAWFWARTNAEIFSFFEGLPDERKLTLAAHPIFGRDLEVLETLFSFAQVEVPPAAKLRSVLGKKFNARNRSSYPPAHEWSEADRLAVRESIADVAGKLGYEDL